MPEKRNRDPRSHRQELLQHVFFMVLVMVVLVLVLVMVVVVLVVVVVVVVMKPMTVT